MIVGVLNLWLDLSCSFLHHLRIQTFRDIRYGFSGLGHYFLVLLLFHLSNFQERVDRAQKN